MQYRREEESRAAERCGAVSQGGGIPGRREVECSTAEMQRAVPQSGKVPD